MRLWRAGLPVPAASAREPLLARLLAGLVCAGLEEGPVRGEQWVEVELQPPTKLAIETSALGRHLLHPRLANPRSPPDSRQNSCGGKRSFGTRSDPSRGATGVVFLSSHSNRRGLCCNPSCAQAQRNEAYAPICRATLVLAVSEVILRLRTAPPAQRLFLSSRPLARMPKPRSLAISAQQQRGAQADEVASYSSLTPSE